MTEHLHKPRKRVNWNLVVAICALLLVAYVNRERLPNWARESLNSMPQADDARFTVAVAFLDKDTDHAISRQIVRGIRDTEELDGVTPREIKKTISLGGNTEAEIAEGHEEARKYLLGSGADLIVWGEVIGRNRSPRLFVTGRGREEFLKTHPLSDDVDLPPLLVAGIQDCLHTVILSKYAVLVGYPASVAGPLLSYISRLKALLASSPNMPPETSVPLQSILASALLVASGTGRTDLLRESIDVRRSIIDDIGPGMTVEHAKQANNLGIAYGILGDRNGDNTSFEQAVVEFTRALEVFTKEEHPWPWAAAMNNLGGVLSQWGQRTADSSKLREAVGIYREVLNVRTQTEFPSDWAMTQSNLCATLAILGGGEATTDAVDEAIEHCRLALTHRTRDRYPLEWTETNLNLVTALVNRAEFDTSLAFLNEALTVNVETCNELDKELTPLLWGRSKYSLGEVYRAIGFRTGRPQFFCEATLAHLDAWKALKNMDHYYGSWANGLAQQAYRDLIQVSSEREAQSCVGERVTELQQIEAMYSDPAYWARIDSMNAEGE